MDADERCALPLGAQQQLQDHPDHDDHDDEEREHFRQVCRSYQQYATFHQTRQRGVDRRMHRTLDSSRIAPDSEGPTIESILPPSLVPQTADHRACRKQFCDATIRNQFFLDSVLKYAGVATSQDVLRQRREERSDNGGTVEWATEDQMSKVDSVLKSVARDWSREGREERGVAYERLVGALERYMPLNERRSPPRVAVPGSGLGRLAWEIYSRGYSAQGSDFSLPMLLASDFVLNGCGIPGNSMEAEEETGSENGSGPAFRQFGISPWISETKNTSSFQNRTRAVVVPDLDPTSLLHKHEDGAAAPEFTMMAGEFLSLYSRFLPNHSKSQCDDSHHYPQSFCDKFHAVVCSFFLDTAPSLPHYLLTIYHMLVEGGLLLHFGPLMYHWSGHGGLLPGDLDSSANHQKRTEHLDQRYLSSIDCTWEEFRHMVLNCGFEILEEESCVPAGYTTDSKSMMRVVYDCSFLVARKKHADG